MRIEEHAKDVAKATARKSDMIFQHGAVIIQGGRVIATGCNYKNGYRWGNGNIFSVHAEIDAIEGTEIRGLRGATLVIYAESHGRQKLSRPCPNCLHILRKLGFRRVIFSTPSEWRKETIK